MITLMWRVLTQPSLDEFEHARAQAHLRDVILTTLLIGMVTGAIGGVINVFAVGDSIVEALTLAIITPFRLLFALIVVNAFCLIAARALGGHGDFSTQMILLALVQIPLNALASLLAAIPTLGAILAIVSLIYNAILSVLALRAAHGGREWRVSNSVLFVVMFIGGIIGWIALSSISQ